MKLLLAISLTLALLSQGGPACTSWGGEHARADVEAEGVSFEFDCAHGAADGPLEPDADGRFDLEGFYVAERGAPVSAGLMQNRTAARYSGQVRGETMTLSVTLTQGGQKIGTFTLTRGRAARLTKCM